MTHRNPGQQAPKLPGHERGGSSFNPQGKRVGTVLAAAGELAKITTHIGDKLPDGQKAVLPRASEIFVGQPRKDGSYSTLRGVVGAGQSTVAIVERRTGNKTTGFALVRTGLGHNAPDGQPRTGVILCSVSLGELEQPGSDGVIQPWKTINVGRNDLNGDPEASRNHFAVTFYKNGDVDVTDGWIDERNGRPASPPSTNGTSVLSGNHFGFLQKGQNYADPDVHVYTSLVADEARWDPAVISTFPASAQGRHALSIVPSHQ